MRSKINLMIVLITAGVITYYSITPLPTSTYYTGGVNTAQLYHLIAYFGLAAALLLYFHDTTKGRLEAVLTAALFGAGLEVIQFFLSSRVFSPLDIGINITGASIILLDHKSRVVTKAIRIEETVLERVL